MSKSIDPAAVKAGDTVTLESDELVANVAGRVTDIQHDHGAWTVYLALGVMGHSTPFVVGVGTSWTLTDHQPAPEPEWEPGTVYSARLAGASDPFHVWSDLDEGERAFMDGRGNAYDTGELLDVRPLVVIDPAEVDVAALVYAYANEAHTAADVEAIFAVLAVLGIEVPS
jgi:hypothetical protein